MQYFFWKASITCQYSVSTEMQKNAPICQNSPRIKFERLVHENQEQPSRRAKPVYKFTLEQQEDILGNLQNAKH